MAKGNLKPEEVEFIRQNCLNKTDEEMATYLGRDVRTVCSARKRLGIIKRPGGRLQKVDVNPLSNQAPQPSQRLNEDQRKEFFKTQLTNTLYYSNLKEQFTKEEIDFYLEEWASLCVQFEDIVATEKRQIDELIKAEIMANRILRNIKITEDEIQMLVGEVEELHAKSDMDDDMEAQERDIQLQTLIKIMSAQSNAMSNDYQKNVSLRNELLNELNARRRDRVDQISKRGTTFLGLVEAFRDRNTRETQGRHIELVKIAKQKKQAEWRTATRFADGTQDCVLMDEHSILPQKEAVRLIETGESLIDTQEAGSKVLIVDDELERCNFFQGRLKDCKLEFASNADKAIKLLSENHYDLICLDYDLGLGQKGAQVADFLVMDYNNTFVPVLIHSMNPEGAKQMKEILSANNRIVEVRRYIDIRDNLENKNA